MCNLERADHRHETRECQLASDVSKDAPSPLDDCLPGLVVLDDESIADDPFPSCDLGSKGENGDNIWHLDHPSLENEPAPPPPT